MKIHINNMSPDDDMENYLPRTIERELLKWLDDGYSVILVGPRQAGKTTLLKHLVEVRGGKYLSLDDPDIMESLTNPKLFARMLGGREFYLDEAQYDKDVGRKLKYLHDVEGYRFVASGSGSFDIKVRVSGELVGRAARLVLLPLDFHEFVLWKDEKLAEIHSELREVAYRILSGKEDEFPYPDVPQLRSLWDEYVLFGGYPRVVLSDGFDRKREILTQILTAYLDRDVFGFLGVREHAKFTRTLRALAMTAGSILNKSHVAELSATTIHTLEGYISILEQTFVVFRVYQYPFSASALRKQPKIYFYDLGLRNAVLSEFSPLSERVVSAGAIVENFVARHLKQQFGEIHFWRSRSGAEVDFIVNNIPVEVKSGKRRSRAIHALAERLGSPHKVIIRLGPAERHGDAYLVPPWFL